MIAPHFDLRDLDGRYRSLSEWRGRRILLVFVQPDCPHSRRLLPVIAGLRTDPPADIPAPIVISFGQETENRALVQEFGLRCPVLIQDDTEIASAYLTEETPAGCLVDEHGRMVDSTRTGAVNVLVQAGVTPGPMWPWSTTDYKSAGHWYYELIAPRVDEILRALDPTRMHDGVFASPIPLVSVIMTTRDRPGLLAIALECYRRQTYANRELIVVDDGVAFPADKEVIAAVGGRVIRVPPGTPLGAKLNRGVSEARGSLCQKWDDDDWYAPRFLDVLVSAYLRENGVVHLPTVAFQMRRLWFDLSGWRVQAWTDNEPSGATLLFARQDWLNQPFREIRSCEDFWFVVDQVRAGASPFPIVGEELYISVRHGELENDRGHTWAHWLSGERMEDHDQAQERESRAPADLFPDWALSAYARLRMGRRIEGAGVDARPSGRRLGGRIGDKPSLLYLTPVVPGFTGNGIRMRAGMNLEALAECYDVYLLVVPIWPGLGTRIPEGIAGMCRDCRVVRPVLDAESPSLFGVHADGSIKRAPDIWRNASAESVRSVAEQFRDVPFDIVYTYRLYMSPFAEPYLNAVPRPLWHLDLDDVESEARPRIAQRYRARGLEYEAAFNDQEADGFAAMEAALLPRFDRIYVCSERDRETVRSRYFSHATGSNERVHVLPNSVRLPPLLPPNPETDTFTFIFAGILSYYPNEDAILFLGNEVVPLLRRLAPRPFRIAVIGSDTLPWTLYELAQLPEIEFIGEVRHMDRWYYQADAVLAPIRAGGGTRIKILEAMSYRRPVVSTSLGIEGLDVRDEEHVLVADTAEGFAEQCLRLMSDPKLRRRLTDDAFELCARRYSPAAVARALTVDTIEKDPIRVPFVAVEEGSRG